MSNFTPSLKEQFFSLHLVPTGQLAEMYFRLAPAKQTGKVTRFVHGASEQAAQFLYDALGLTSAFAISPATPADAKLFKKLIADVEAIASFLSTELAPLNHEHPSSAVKSAFNKNAITFAERLRPLTDQLLKTIEFAPASSVQWMKRIMAVPTALTMDGKYSKWRTLVRNYDFEENMRKRGHYLTAKAVAPVGSSAGMEQAPALWRECFDTDWGSADRVRAARPTLPKRAEVKSNASGLLDITMTFDPRRALKKVLASITPLPAGEFRDDLAEVRFERTCDYTQLPAVVQEMNEWELAQFDKTAKTTKKLMKWEEGQRVKAVQAKFEKNFTDEERELLAKGKPRATTRRKAA
jgi:hypothetical protein